MQHVALFGDERALNRFALQQKPSRFNQSALIGLS